ncbi:hypothetical protein BD289DRAFT_200059 [Coniella lustricola]|uniref:Secreted protein n=1 Tax=Coniella lustricola TaxID=2025994 RepID=A0A2T2ZSL0_9PEZI|nr:hypothetical protein BD289DRAFT_200059 [Coniella lustricola]
MTVDMTLSLLVVVEVVVGARLESGQSASQSPGRVERCASCCVCGMCELVDAIPTSRARESKGQVVECQARCERADADAGPCSKGGKEGNKEREDRKRWQRTLACSRVLSGAVVTAARQVAKSRQKVPSWSKGVVSFSRDTERQRGSERGSEEARRRGGEKVRMLNFLEE